MAGPTQELAGFVEGLVFDDLDEEVVAWCKTLILDQFGSELVGSTMPWAKKVFRYVKSLEKTGACTVVNYGLRVNPELAAFANGTFGHSFDVDDFNGYGRPGSAIIPAILAAGELRKISGRELVVAIVAGYEVWARVMRSISPSALLDRGFHTVSLIGVFGAVAGVAKVLSLGRIKTANAFGLAGSHAGGLSEFTNVGTDVMRIHAGIAAMGGLRSAVLASLGFTGPQNILEGEKGYVKAFADEYDIDSLTRGLGTDWLILNTGIKPYACATSIHPAILSIEKIRKAHRFEINKVNEVVVGTNSLALAHGGGKIGPSPKDVTGMQYSIEFSVAIALVLRDNLLKGYSGKNLHDPRITQMAKKVRLVLDQGVEKELNEHGRISGRVTIIMKDGKRFQADSLAKGQPYFPMTRGEIVEKFKTMAQTVISKTRAWKLVEEVEHVDNLRNASKLLTMMLATETT